MLIPLPNKKYNIIYADPPWPYKQIHRTGSTKTQFDTLSINEIKSLPISDIASDPCFLFLWIPNPKLNEVFDVIKSWEFDYKTVAFVWKKEYPKTSSMSHFPDYMGMGYYTRPSCELCLLAIRGSNPTKHVINHVVLQFIQADRGKHSEKPNEVRERIVKLLGDLPRIELFARHKIEGWDSWGNEVGKLVKPLLEQTKIV